MWWRSGAGLVLCALGAIWVLQGVDVLHGSAMSGHGQYAGLGVVSLLAGAALLVWAARSKRRPLSDEAHAVASAPDEVNR